MPGERGRSGEFEEDGVIQADAGLVLQEVGQFQQHDGVEAEVPKRSLFVSGVQLVQFQHLGAQGRHQSRGAFTRPAPRHAGLTGYLRHCGVRRRGGRVVLGPVPGALEGVAG